MAYCRMFYVCRAFDREQLFPKAHVSYQGRELKVPVFLTQQETCTLREVMEAPARPQDGKGENCLDKQLAHFPH